MTPYAIAWKKFIESPRGRACVERAMRNPTDRYAENAIREAFDAGWNSARDAYDHEAPVDG